MIIDHVGVAVESLSAALDFYQGRLGLALEHREAVASQGVKVAFLRARRDGGASVELLEPTDAEAAVARFIAKRGPGLHHVAFRVDDIKGEMERLKCQGLEPLENTGPRAGARGHQVCFYHPRDCLGTLIELVG